MNDRWVRLYVYGIVTAFVIWTFVVSWLATRTAWRMLRQRPLGVIRLPGPKAGRDADA